MIGFIFSISSINLTFAIMKKIPRRIVVESRLKKN